MTLLVLKFCFKDQKKVEKYFTPFQTYALQQQRLSLADDDDIFAK